jgi:hypothetical protein
VFVEPQIALFYSQQAADQASYQAFSLFQEQQPAADRGVQARAGTPCLKTAISMGEPAHRIAWLAPVVPR